MKIQPFPLLLALVAPLAPALADQPTPGAVMLQNWDLNADETVTLDEVTQKRSTVFASFDANEDGFLDVEEYKTFNQARAGHVKQQGAAGKSQMKKAAAGMGLAQNDNDGDGKVSQQEFLGNAAKWIKGLDKNGDGVVTAADFAA